MLTDPIQFRNWQIDVIMKLFKCGYAKAAHLRNCILNGK